MDKHELKCRVEQLERLPAPLAARLVQVSAEESGFRQQAAEITAADPALTAQVFRLAGSVLSSFAEPILSVEKAVAFLGPEAVRGVALLTTVGPSRNVLQALWTHSVTCAAWADCLAARIDSPLREAAYAAGLLHDLGKLVLCAVAAGTPDSEVAGRDAERRVFGADHTLAGKWLAERWGLPEPFVEAIWLHHLPPDTRGAIARHADLLELVSLANRLAHGGPDALMGTRLNVTDAIVEELRPEVRARVDRLRSLLELKTDKGASVEALRVRTAALERLLTLERQQQRLRALQDMHLRLRPGTPPTQVLDAVAEAVQGGLRIAPALFFMMDSREVWIRGKAWRTSDDPPVDLRLNLERDDPSERVDLDPRLLGALRALTEWGTRRSASPQTGMKPSAPAATGAVVRRGPLVVLPMLAEGAVVGQILFEAASAGVILGGQDLTGVLEFVRACGLAVLRATAEARLRERCEDLAAALHDQGESREAPSGDPDVERLRTFVSGAAHHINNPLAVISGRAQQLAGKGANPTEAKALNDIVEQSRRVHEILNDLVAFANPAQFRMDPALINFVLHQSVASVRERLEQKRITVAEQYAEGLPRVPLDRHQMGRVFLNLIANAESAMTGAGGTLTIQTRTNPNRGAVIISIQDTGPGMAPEVLGRAFDPFFTTRKEGEGLGLGLAVCQGVVRSHHGALELRSEPGRGTTAVITLPCAVENIPTRENGPRVMPRLVEAESLPLAASPKVGQTFQSAPRQPARPTILVANEDDDLREILKQTLRKCGYLVQTAVDGAEALELVKTQPVDLVLLDLRMPKRDGLSVLTELHNRYASLPVIVTTGRASTDEVDEAFRLGARSCLRKPFEIKRLLSEVEQLVANARI